MDTVDIPSSGEEPSPKDDIDRSVIATVQDSGGQPFTLYLNDPDAPCYEARNRLFHTTRAGFAVETVGAPLDVADLRESGDGT